MANLNRIKVVLVEQQKTGKWLAEQMGKSACTVSKWCSNSSQPDLATLDYSVGITFWFITEITIHINFGYR